MLKPGDKVNERYAISRTISTGLLSNVYDAQDTAIQRRVVLKELIGEKNRPSTARIQREVELYSRLRHPHILELLDVLVTAGTVYLIFPFIEGGTLADLIARGPIPTERALGIARDVTQAVAFIHAKGIIHRDLKPANILIDEGRALLADFGIAKESENEGSLVLTRQGEALGTPIYMAPEALGNESVDRPADVYSLGVVLFEMLSGRPPFSGRTLPELIANRLKSGPPHLAQVRPGIHPALAGLVEKMLQPDPHARPTAQKVSDDLAAISAHTVAVLPHDSLEEVPTTPQAPLPPAMAATLGGEVPPPPPVTRYAPAPPTTGAQIFEAPSLWATLSRTIHPGLASTVVVRDGSVSDTLQDQPTEKAHGFFHDEFARQEELAKSREFYRTQLSDDYGNLMFQAKVSFALWVLFSVVGFVVFIIGITLLYAGRWQEGAATMVSESIVVFIQKLFKDREDEFRERAAKKNRHVELGNLWNLAAQSLDGLDTLTRREKLGKLTDALIAQVGKE